MKPIKHLLEIEIALENHLIIYAIFDLFQRQVRLTDIKGRIIQTLRLPETEIIEFGELEFTVFELREILDTCWKKLERQFIEELLSNC